MRFVTLFLLSFGTFSIALWLLVDATEPAPELPERAPDESTEPVLTGTDLADEYGQAPFAGEVRRLEGLVLRVLDPEERYERFHVRLGRLGRADGRPRIEGVEGAFFDPPEQGRPVLRATLQADFADADAARLLHAAEGASKRLRLGGVVVRDAAGRTLARIREAELDLDAETLETKEAVHLRYPRAQVEVRGSGLRVDLGLNRAVLGGDVAGSVRLGEEGLVAFGCAGPATVTLEEDLVFADLEERAYIDHPVGRALAGRLHVEAERVEGGRAAFVGARLEGGVDFALDRERFRGLEGLQAPAVTIEGEERVIFRGPVRAVRRGSIGMLEGERTIDVEAGGLVLHLEGRRPASAELEGFLARDRDGAGLFRAQTVRYDAIGKDLEATGAVALESADLGLKTERLFLKGDRKELHARMAGKTRAEVRRRGRQLRLHAAEQLVLVLRDGELASLDAAGEVEADEAGGARLQGEQVRFDGERFRAAGTPASIVTDGRTLRARELSYEPRARTFDVGGGVDVEAFLGKRPWRLRFERAGGALDPERDELSQLEASGHVEGTGPGGEHFSGTTLTYDAGERTAVLLGKPARLEQGDALRLEAPGFDLAFEGRELLSARTRGEASLLYYPAAGRVVLWKARLHGAATFEDDRVNVPDGAELEAFGESDARLVSGDAAHVVLHVARKKNKVTPTLLEGSGGVSVRSARHSVRADRMRYAPGSRQVEVFDARVAAEGWPSDVRFERLVFVLGKEGVDLKRASGVIVREPR